MKWWDSSKLALYDFDAEIRQNHYRIAGVGRVLRASIGTFLENDLSEKPVGIFVSSESGRKPIKHMKDDFKLNNVIAELELISPLQGLEEVTRRIDAFCAVL